MTTKQLTVPEPDFQTACQWWADLPNIWTPVGWKDHMFRFNVLWNGTLLAKPDMNRRTEQYAGQGLQLSLTPSFIAKPNFWQDWGSGWLHHDDGMVNQGWNADAAPVLWTEWSKDGLLLRSEVFAHIPGGADVATGIEPLFAWMRLSVHELCAALPLEPVHGFNLWLEAPHLTTTMSMRDNIWRHPESAAYPRPLRYDSQKAKPGQGCRIMEPNSKVRLAVAPGKFCSGIQYFPPGKDHREARLHVQLPARRGAFVDLLVPMLPCDRRIFDAELKLGYDGALRQTRKYWQRITATPTRFAVPETDVNEIIRQSVRFSNILTEKNPATGKYCKINGSWTYADLWTTPVAMDFIMMLDTLGHHTMVERYLEILREEQGTVVPPGPTYELHPGYFSTPALYQSIDWLSDNGAVLWTICRHALLSGHQKFAERFTDCIVKSCDWLKAARTKTGHGGYPGVLPAAVATDCKTEIQALWSIGWNYKGLVEAVKVLRRLGHPRAAEFAAEAKETRAAFLRALRDKCRQMPRWTDARGRKRVLVPTALAGDERQETRNAFYLDTGPLFLVFAGLMPASDPLMDDVRRWFREGPQQKFYRRDSNCWQVPVLDHEMSSCEPCYSWNLFHTLQQGDREKFMEGLYSVFAGSISRKTRVSCETRGGVTGNAFSAPLAIYLSRLAVIDDELVENELHLLRLMPLAWLKPGAASAFEKMPTEFGPVTLLTKVSADGQTLAVTFKPAFRKGAAPARIRLHVPPIPGLKRLVVNGKRHGIKSSIELPVE